MTIFGIQIGVWAFIRKWVFNRILTVLLHVCKMSAIVM